MNRQDYYNIITKVFNYDEVTEHKINFILNKWHRTKEAIELPSEICIILSILDILEFDSGNFETGEKHYILNKNKLSEALSSEFYYTTIKEEFVESLLPIYREMILNEALS
tara:strand:- start:1337 stop:1669 length:333 start_codon:yes stop_codon:yes gene_type:complete